MNKNLRIIISCLAIIVLLQVAGRWWVMYDSDTPGYGQTACYTILLTSRDVALLQSVHQSLSNHTDIASRLKGEIESKAYTPSLFALGYVKINAPEDSIGEIATAVRHHLSTSFPSITPEYRLGFTSATGGGLPPSP